MNKLSKILEAKKRYDRGENVIEYLKKFNGDSSTEIEDILISYDLQSGSYIKGLHEYPESRKHYCNEINDFIKKCGDINSIMEVGVGEATTLGNVLKASKRTFEEVYGFDISWSRLSYAKNYLADIQVQDVQLFTGDLFNIPLPDNSIDLVYTMHSLEPNGGREEQALKELYRVAKKYILLIEPSYKNSDKGQKTRMEQHGYVKDLDQVARHLEYEVIEDRKLDYSVNPLNPSGLIAIKKDNKEVGNAPRLVCPITRTNLKNQNDCLLSSEEGLICYPVIKEIPCLVEKNAILTTHLEVDYQDYKRENGITI